MRPKQRFFRDALKGSAIILNVSCNTALELDLSDAIVGKATVLVRNYQLIIRILEIKLRKMRVIT